MSYRGCVRLDGIDGIDELSHLLTGSRSVVCGGKVSFRLALNADYRRALLPSGKRFYPICALGLWPSEVSLAFAQAT